VFVRKAGYLHLRVRPENGRAEAPGRAQGGQIDLGIAIRNEWPDHRGEVQLSGRDHETHGAVHLAARMPAADIIHNPLANPLLPGQSMRRSHIQPNRSRGRQWRSQNERAAAESRHR
jgi:hypothetical protein